MAPITPGTSAPASCIPPSGDGGQGGGERVYRTATRRTTLAKPVWYWPFVDLGFDLLELDDVEVGEILSEAFDRVEELRVRRASGAVAELL